jgi:hypothetical protein
MNTGHEISFTSMADIAPSSSTFTDVIRLLGTDYEVERVPSRRSKTRLFQAKVVLHFQKFGLAVVFISPDFLSLLPETPVLIVGAESGCTLRTDSGLHIGMPLAEAVTIIKENYAVRYEASDCIEITPIDGEGQPFLALHHNNDRIEFIGLHRIQTERSGR